MRVLCKRTASGLQPLDQQATEELRKVPLGRSVYVELVRARNARQHRFVMKLLSIIADHGEYPSTDAALVALKLATGHVEEIRMNKDGSEVRIIPKSIAFANLSQSDYETWMTAALQVVTERWLPGVSSDDLRKEIEEMIN